MIENQLRPNKITNITLLDIFNEVSKEKFISEDNLNICYSDQDISVLGNRGYLKNLHLAQILHFADIKMYERVLHIGGLTGYLSVLISKLCKEIYVTEEDDKSKIFVRIEYSTTLDSTTQQQITLDAGGSNTQGNY